MYQSVYLAVCLSLCPSVCMSVCVSIVNIYTKKHTHARSLFCYQSVYRGVIISFSSIVFHTFRLIALFSVCLFTDCHK